MKLALATICALTLLAVAYLSVSVMVLQPPHFNYPVQFALASVFVAQDVLTLAALGARPARARSARIRYAVLVGGVLVAALGVWIVRRTITSAHFEGYALVLGSMLVTQGMLTFVAFLAPEPFRTA
jgi:hypothetical protein